MKKTLLSFLILCCGLMALAQEEFNGPLPGWANARTRFGAAGDGKKDDTRALQDAIDNLTQTTINFNTGGNAYWVLYLPAGTYNISSTLNLKGKIGVSIIGESPTSVTIRWIGKDGATMFDADGSAYFKLSRIGWDPGGKKEMEAVSLRWRNKFTTTTGQSNAPVNIEFSDLDFKDGFKYGLAAGTVAGEGIGQMDSEISVRRCQFRGCTEAGVYIKGYNALDYWIWDCQFLACRIGVFANFGNYHLYRSLFKGNTFIDVHNNMCYYTSVRGCLSDSAYEFSNDLGASSNPFKRIFQANQVHRPRQIPVEYYHAGKISMMDNVLDSALQPVTKTFIQTGTWAKSNNQMLSVNNTFANAAPLVSTQAPYTVFAYGGERKGKKIPPASVDSFLATMDKTPAAVTRKIFTVARDAKGAEIQQRINEASAMKGQRAIVYIPGGTHVLDKPLEIPAGADLQVSGDGYLYSTLLVTGAGFPEGAPYFRVQGPSSAVIRDLQLGNFTTQPARTNGIEFVNVDQTGSMAFVEQLYSNSRNAIDGRDLDHLTIQETNSFYAYGNSMSGGPLTKAGKGDASFRTFGGQFAGLTVKGNGKFIAKDCWWEGEERQPLQFNGQGDVTIDGVMVAPVKADSLPTIVIGKHSGKISILNSYLQGGLQVAPDNPGLELLFWNDHFYHALDPTRTVTSAANYKAAFIGLSAQCFMTGDPKCADIVPVADVKKGSFEQEAFFLKMLADDRASMPAKYIAAPAGRTNIYVSRVAIGDCNTAVRFSN